METGITESNTNRLIRIILKVILTFGMFFGVILIIFQIAVGNILISAIGIPIFFISYYLRDRIVRIKKIEENCILLTSGKKEVNLNKCEILSISKFMRFTFSERFLMMISLNKGKLPILNCYFFMNEPREDFINRFLSMGFRLKNIP